MRVMAWIIVCSLLLPAAATTAQLYRYTDERGVVHVVGSPEEIPERYRPSSREVTGQVTRVSTGQPATNEMSYQLGDLARFLPGADGARPAWLIVAFELWRSKLLFALLGLFGLSGMFLLGLVLSHNVPRERRLRVQARLVVSFALTVVLFWLALFGPGLGRMLRGCAEEADRSVTLTEDEGTRKGLIRLHDFADQTAEQVESLLWQGPA